MSVRRHYEEQLQALQRDLVAFGEMVVAAVGRALEVMRNNDAALAQQIIADDEQADAAQQRIESQAVTLIATQQPVARDLRNIMAAITISSELERVADYAKGIAQFVTESDGKPPLHPSPELLDFGQTALTVFQDAIGALKELNVDRARAVAAEEAQLDRRYDQLLAALAEGLARDHDGASRFADMLLIAYNLERVADRATNIAERIIYSVSGQMEKLKP